MKLYVSVKTLLKGLRNSFMIHLLYFLAFPLFLAWLLGMTTEKMFENPIKTEAMSIVIQDEDNSNLSARLASFLKDDLSSILSVEKSESNADLKLLIPNGYENNILNKKANTIDIDKLKDRDEIAILLQDVLNTYHEKLYLSSSPNLNRKNLDELFSKNSINTSMIDGNIKQNSYEYFAIVSLGFLMIMFIMNNTLTSYISESNGISKRLYSLPVSRVHFLIYDFVGLWVYSFIFLILYVLFFRLLGITFDGNIFILILLCSVSSLFISSISTFISSFFGKKLGTLIVYLFLLLQTIFGGIFTMLNDIFLDFSSFSPTYLVGKIFTNYEIYNNFSSIGNLIFICLAISMALLLLAMAKEKYKWREI